MKSSFERGSISTTLSFIVIAILVFFVCVYVYFYQNHRDISEVTSQENNNVIQVVQNPDPAPVKSQLPTQSFEGYLRKINNSWILVISMGKIIETYKVEFSNSSVCTIGAMVSPCISSVTQANFGVGNTMNNGGGDSVKIEANINGDTISVQKLLLKENFIANGSFRLNTNKEWIFNNSSFGNFPIKVDSDSQCSVDGGQKYIKCTTDMFIQNQSVFLHALKFRNFLFIRSLTFITKTAPDILPNQGSN